MRYDLRYRSRSSFFYSSFPNGVKWLIVANVALYLLYFFTVDRAPGLFFPFQLIPYMVLHGAIWQPVTYLFLHDPHGLFHILFNMLALWMFGTPVEETWGTRRFLQFYFLCGVGAGVCVVLAGFCSAIPFSPPSERRGYLRAFARLRHVVSGTGDPVHVPLSDEGEVRGHHLWRHRVPRLVPGLAAPSVTGVYGAFDRDDLRLLLHQKPVQSPSCARRRKVPVPDSTIGRALEGEYKLKRARRRSSVST